MLIRFDEKAKKKNCDNGADPPLENDDGDDDDDDDDDEVRVAINPSLLQRFCGNGYYYIDDVPVPFKALLDEERILLPSAAAAAAATRAATATEPLLQHNNTNNNNNNGSISTSKEDIMFDHLWIRFCARLAEYQAEHNESYKVQRGMLGLIGVTAVSCLVVWPVVSSFEMTMMMDSPFLSSIIVACFFLYVIALMSLATLPMDQVLTMYNNNNNNHGDYKENEYHRIQQLVDDLAPAFSESGYHVDHVVDNRRYCPMLVYVRFTKIKSRNAMTQQNENDDNDNDDNVTISVPSSPYRYSLAEQMYNTQQRVWQDHIETTIMTRRQQQLSERIAARTAKSSSLLSSSDSFLEKVLPYQQVIIICSLPLAFFFLVMNFSQYTSNYGYSMVYTGQHHYATYSVVGHQSSSTAVARPVVVENGVVVSGIDTKNYDDDDTTVGHLVQQQPQQQQVSKNEEVQNLRGVTMKSVQAVRG